ncbi:PQQ-binding-like beta-propeller repeat protein [Pseudoalteromonas mariniglutinosa]|uniref:outer membrane protein assembly factor BamB family protein n=1 Tax=Pseudoalteromonas mariniglutinosa TaxID=206042 RepID=UPI003850569C
MLINRTLLFVLTIFLTGCGGSSGQDDTVIIDGSTGQKKDSDGDGVLDVDDAFPFDSSETLDTDGDGIGNNKDNDDDNDGVLDADDAFPLDSSETLDTDGDGIGNNKDNDDDNDGVLDVDDAFPLDSSETLDTDGDGIGNNKDNDDDNDGINDDADIEPLNPLVPDDQTDTDGDGATDYIEKHISLTNSNLRDSDGDGMWDGYEIKYKLNPLSDADKTDDNDADGYSNLQEFFANSNPNDFADRPCITSWLSNYANPQRNNFVNIQVDDGNFQLMWSIANPISQTSGTIITNNRLYYVYSSDILEAYNIKDNSLSWRNDTLISNKRNIRLKDDDLIMSRYYKLAGYESMVEDTYLDTLTGNAKNKRTRYADDMYKGYEIYGTRSDDKFTYKIVGPYYGYDFLFVVSQTGADGEGEEVSIDAADYLYRSASASIGSYSNLIIDFEVSSGKREVVNIDPHTLKATWKTQLPLSINNANAIGQGRIYYTNGQNIFVIDESTGEQLANWPVSTKGPLSSKIALANNVLFVGDEYSIYALSLDSGRVIWQKPISGKLSLSKSGELFVNTGAEIYAFAVATNDTDGDSVPDEWEKQSGFDYNNPNDMSEDADNDGLINRLEYQLNTNPLSADTDNDGVNDSDEIKFNSSPFLSDTDRDGLSDYDEIFTYLTQPTLSDSDGDGFSDFDELLLYNSNPNDSSQIPAPVAQFKIDFDNGVLSPHWSYYNSESNANEWNIAGNENKYLEKKDIAGSPESNSNPLKLSYRNYFKQGTLSFELTWEATNYADFQVQIKDEDGRFVFLTLDPGPKRKRIVNMPIDAGFHKIVFFVYPHNNIGDRGANVFQIDNFHFIAD